MALFKLLEKTMSMDDRSWEKHSSPWSVYTRFTLLPLLSVAVWSREWLGIYSFIPIILTLLWTWLNPRAFPPPKKTDNWASMGTFGERIYLNRHIQPIPPHHRVLCRALPLLAALGLPFWLYGLYALNIRALALGNLWIIVFKAWFVDRMVWLYLDMKDSSPVYKTWLKS